MYTVESWFFVPQREMRIGSKLWIDQEIESEITMLDWEEGNEEKLWGHSVWENMIPLYI